MSLFLLVIFGCYSAIHVYAFLKVKAAYPFGPILGILLGIFMAVMTVAPILVRILERHGYDLPAKVLSYVGYFWMGALFLFFFLSLCVDLYRLATYGSGMVLQKKLEAYLPTARTAFLVPLAVALVLSLYGFYNALNIRPEHLTVRTLKIPESIGRLRIVQISDVHLGLIVQDRRLKKILSVIRQADPDILVSTGDLVDGQIDSLSRLADIFREVNPKYGKFAIPGNHEYYAGFPQALEITRRAGFTMLRNEAVTVAGLVNLAGMDDPTGRHFGMSRGPSEETLLSGLPAGKYTILLKHQPRVRESSLGRYDLQLSGHTHNGQIFPFKIFVRLFFSHITGWYRLPGGSNLYVSRGTGTWGPPMRLLASPEVTIIDLVHGDSPGTAQ
jgi:predicted MPP superfamily phosphohydrolase